MVLGRLLVAAAAVTTAASGGGGDSESCPAQESGALSGASMREYCIIGAGPGGLQMAAQLEGSLALGVVRSYAVFERAPEPGSFFRRYPRHRTLLSPSKTQTGTANLEANLRHDRNSLLPFEPPYMEAAGMRCDFVGHPVVTDPQASPQQAAEFRARHGLGQAPLCLILPGSRRSEVTRLAPVFAQVVARLYAARPDLRFVLPAASPVAGLVSDLCTGWPGAPLVLDPRGAGEVGRAEKRAAFAAADVALAASGTVSLELAAADTPMVIAYDMGWLSRQIIGRMLRVDTVTLVNLVSETRSVPEFIGKACRPDSIATALLQVLDAPEPQRAAMALTMQRLGQGGAAPGTRAAMAVLDHPPPSGCCDQPCALEIGIDNEIVILHRMLDCGLR